MGPYPQVLPGEKVKFTIAMVCAKRSPGSFDASPLANNMGWARRTFQGEDANGNGALDAGEDLNTDGKLTRFVLPTPPNAPRTRYVAENNKVTVYWDNNAESSIDPISKQADFEGYKLYRTNPGQDLKLNLLSDAKLLQEWDKPGNKTGVNNGFAAIRLAQPKMFDGDPVAYTYKYEIGNVLNGWQYLYALTSFDAGDSALGLPPLESSFTQAAKSVYAGTPPTSDGELGVYPNPYSISGAWDGTSSRSRKLYFNNLPEQCQIRIYTLSGDVVAELDHNAATYSGQDAEWFSRYSRPGAVFSGGEHAWDLLSDSKQSLVSGLYLFTVKDLRTGREQRGKFAIIK
jgi:hypothetical protein